jgi:hypothetical protein
MKIFYLIFFSPLIFGCSHDPIKDDLIQLYKDTKRIYLKNPKNKYPYSRFNKSNGKLFKTLKNLYQTVPVELFNIIEKSANCQMAHLLFVEILSMELGDDVDILDDSSDLDTWKEHLDAKAAIYFFQRSKDLVRHILRSHDSKDFKVIIPIILSIQRRNIHFIKNHRIKMKAFEFIYEYEFIRHTFEPGNINTLLKLYEKLKPMALENNGIIPETGKGRFFIKTSLTLFGIYCRQFYDKYWRDLDEFKVTAIPRELLYFILRDLSNISVFWRLGHLQTLSLNDFYSISGDNFSDIINIFTAELNTSWFDSIGSFYEDNSSYAKLMRESIGDKPHPRLSEKHLWIIKCIFHILPILKISKV